MLGLFAGLLVFGCVFYTEGLVPAVLMMPDGSKIDCGSPVPPAGGTLCAQASESDVIAAAAAFILMLSCLAAMIALSIVHARRPWQQRGR